MITDYLYLWLKEQLKTIPEIKVIEMDFDQDESGPGDENQLISTPAILINLTDDSESADLADYNQECEMDVQIRLITKNVRHKDDRVRKAGASENHFDIGRKVFKKLQRIHSGKLSEIPEFAALSDTDNDFNLVEAISRNGHGFDNDFSKYVRSFQTFHIRFIDVTANQNWDSVVAELEITNLDILP